MPDNPSYAELRLRALGSVVVGYVHHGWRVWRWRWIHGD